MSPRQRVLVGVFLALAIAVSLWRLAGEPHPQELVYALDFLGAEAQEEVYPDGLDHFLLPGKVTGLINLQGQAGGIQGPPTCHMCTPFCYGDVQLDSGDSVVGIFYAGPLEVDQPAQCWISDLFVARGDWINYQMIVRVADVQGGQEAMDDGWLLERPRQLAYCRTVKR